MVSALAMMRAIGWRRIGANSRPITEDRTLARRSSGKGEGATGGGGTSLFRHSSKPCTSSAGPICGISVTRQARGDPSTCTTAPSSSRQCRAAEVRSPGRVMKSVHGRPIPARTVCTSPARSAASLSAVSTPCRASSRAVNSASARSISARRRPARSAGSDGSGLACQWRSTIWHPSPCGVTSIQARMVSCPSCATMGRASFSPNTRALATSSRNSGTAITPGIVPPQRVCNEASGSSALSKWSAASLRASIRMRSRALIGRHRWPAPEWRPRARR